METETETETELRDERKRKRDEKWKQKLVWQIDGSYESNIFICSIQWNFNDVLPKSDFIEVEPDTEMETETERGQKMKTETCDTNWKLKSITHVHLFHTM
jgi:hypothetical protein